jgi:hypothetical protein
MSENVGQVNVVSAKVPRPLISDGIEAMYLKDFLSRPVNILNFNWLETDTYSTVRSVEPWFAFFNDARIKQKMHNFAFLQCILKVKILINASPFYYGAMLSNYQPLHNLNPSTSSFGTLDQHLVELSQRPHIWVYPQGNQGGEIVLPYINYRMWTRTMITQDYKDLGKLFFHIASPLTSANGAVGVGVTVSIFAWAEDVNLSGATLGQAMAQSGDEYKSISTPSSYVATIAGALVNVPIIGAFARATEIGAKAISSIAHLFGFTNVPNLNDVDPVMVRPFHNFADTSISFPIDKLTLDPKNELSISQAVAGLPDDEDPLVIENFIKRESYLANFDWTTLNNPNDILYYANVTPTWCTPDSSSAFQDIIHCTPMSYTAALFGQWRGDIIVRFRIIASQYHKGRIRFIYDPFGDNINNIVTVTDSYTGCFSQIIDIGSQDNIEFRIPYSQATPFLNCQSFGVADNFSTGFAFTRDTAKHNGAFAIRCVTALTAPIASSSIKILVSVRSASVEFANPAMEVSTGLKTALKPVQSGLEYDVGGEIIPVGAIGEADPNTYDIVYGEKVLSFRQLLKRMALIVALDQRNVSADWSVQTLTLGRFPPSFGYHANGLLSAVSIVNPLTSIGFDWSQLCPLTWLTPCFVGQRGSVNYAVSYAPTAGITRAEIVAYRIPSYSTPTNAFGTTGAPGVNYSTYGRFIVNWFNGMVNGGTLGCAWTNHGFEFQVPMYSQYKFISTKVDQGTLRTATDGSDFGAFEVRIRSRATQYNSGFQVYCGAGTDFNLIFFVNCPVVFRYSQVPAAGTLI